MQDNKFKELLMKKKGEGKILSPGAAEGKMAVIQQLMDAMGNDMGDKLKGMQKVTVMAPDAEGLEEGLEQAGEVVSEADEVMSEEGEEESEEVAEEMSKEEIEAKIAELQAQLGESSEEIV